MKMLSILAALTGTVLASATPALAKPAINTWTITGQSEGVIVLNIDETRDPMTNQVTATITGVDTANSWFDENGGRNAVTGLSFYASADNLLPLDPNGASFHTSGPDGNDINIYVLNNFANASHTIAGTIYAAYTRSDYDPGGFAPYNNSLTIVSAVVGGVPEPTSWALMITGFGLVGLATRRRRIYRVAA